jgi:hypothetical protein
VPGGADGDAKTLSCPAAFCAIAARDLPARGTVPAIATLGPSKADFEPGRRSRLCAWRSFEHFGELVARDGA